MAPVARFLRHGLRFGLGLDGCTHDDDQDYFRDLRLTSRVHAGTGLDHALPASRLFDAACRDGFRCIDGSDDYGVIAPGARADLVVLDFAAMCGDYLTPDADEVDVILTRATARHVRRLVVAGREVVSDGALVGLDLPAMEEELMDRARGACTRSTPTRRRAGGGAGKRSGTSTRPAVIWPARVERPVPAVHRDRRLNCVTRPVLTAFRGINSNGRFDAQTISARRMRHDLRQYFSQDSFQLQPG